MNHVDSSELLARAAKGRLTPEEQARFDQLLASDPAFRDSWEQEKLLQNALSALPNAPISSNFTSLVLQAARKQPTASINSRKTPRWVSFSWPARLATLGLACLAFVFTSFQYKNYKRTQFAESLSIISDAATVLASDQENPGEAAALLRDFEAIARLSKVPAEEELDLELLVALQK